MKKLNVAATIKKKNDVAIWSWKLSATEERNLDPDSDLKRRTGKKQQNNNNKKDSILANWVLAVSAHPSAIRAPLPTLPGAPVGGGA